jgi:hypothetical protein
VTRRKSLSDTGVANLKPRAERYTESDPDLRGHYVRVAPSGAKSFVAVARDAAGKQVWATIGSTDRFSIEEAREKAREAINRIRLGLPPFPAPRMVTPTFGDVAQTYLKRHVEAKALRSQYEIERLLKQHILPVWRIEIFSASGAAMLPLFWIRSKIITVRGRQITCWRLCAAL